MINRYTFAGLLAVLGVVGVFVLAAVALNGDADPIGDRPTDTAAADVPAPAPTEPGATATPKATRTPSAKAGTSGLALPAQKTKDLVQAARAAGCTVSEEVDEGNEHVERIVTAADYGTNPPTSGMHAPSWAPDELYPPGNTPELGTLVHTLEHGRINIQYREGTDARTITRLGKLYEELDKGYHLLLYQNTTDMPFAVAATAWDHMLGCPEMNDRVFDALRTFRATFIDQGPETVP